jgi:Ca2+-binding RTX toxin-like protein
MATIRGTNGKNRLKGTNSPDKLLGLAGNDTLDGKKGADKMIGGIGDDTYLVDHTGDKVIEKTGQGTDTVKSKVTFTLGANVENLTLTGTAAIDGTGNALGNIIVGNAGANTLFGGDGADALLGEEGDDVLIGGTGGDFLAGGGGNDTASYEINSGGLTIAVLQAFASGIGINPMGDAAGDVYDGIENLRGSSGSDILGGDANANRLDGLDGDDFLIGRGGGDILDGGANGAGGDTAAYFTAETGVIVHLTAGGASGSAVGGDEAFGDTLIGIENLMGSQHNDELTGDSSANQIDGLSGDDQISGGDGNDYLRGGAGDDRLKPGDGDDRLEGDDGYDWLDFSGRTTSVQAIGQEFGTAFMVGGYTFDATGIEAIQGTSSADTIKAIAFNGFTTEIRGGLGDDHIVVYTVPNNAGGGAYAVSIVWIEYDKGVDIIDGYGDDSFRVGREEFGFSHGGGLLANEFLSGDFNGATPVATNNGPQFIYDNDRLGTDNLYYGALWFDRDGTGSAFAPKLVANFDGNEIPSHYLPNISDFLIV